MYDVDFNVLYIFYLIRDVNYKQIIFFISTFNVIWNWIHGHFSLSILTVKIVSFSRWKQNEIIFNVDVSIRSKYKISFFKFTFYNFDKYRRLRCNKYIQFHFENMVTKLLNKSRCRLLVCNQNIIPLFYCTGSIHTIGCVGFHLNFTHQMVYYFNWVPCPISGIARVYGMHMCVYGFGRESGDTIIHPVSSAASSNMFELNQNIYGFT